MWAEIDLDAIAHNVRTLAALAAPAKLYAVLKANAYGHGAVGVAGVALEAGAAGIGVICVDEGAELRRAGVDAPILILGATPESQAADIVEFRLTPTVGTMQMALGLSRFASAKNVTQRVHIELESGLNRHGLLAEPLVAFAEALRELPAIEVEGVFTHFAAAEEGDQAFTRGQFDALLAVSARLPWIPLRHCAATASILDTPEFHLDLVRAGLGVYGYPPTAGCGEGIDLRPAMALKSRVARVMDVEPGATVGYGRTWTAQRASKIALVMCGYADGYRRSLSNRAQIIVLGRRAPVTGRIAMDMCMADVTDAPGVAPGDEAVIMGAQDGERIDADELADLAGTISWEILAGVTQRVPRIYLRGGNVVAASTLTEPLTRTIAMAPVSS